MDKREVIKIAENYIRLISGKYVLQKAILFGSYAKDNFTADSDIDIAIILQGRGDIFETRIELMKLRRDIDLRIEPHPFTSVDFNPSNPIAYEIMKHGIELKK